MAGRQEGITPPPAPKQEASSPISANASFVPRPAQVATQQVAFIPKVESNPQLLPSEGSLSNSEINQAIQNASRSRGRVGLRLNDLQMSMVSNMACRTCGQSGYTVTIYTPQEWVELAARRAAQEMLPFGMADVSPEMRLPLMHVLALPSTPRYLNGAGFSMASSVHRVVLTDTSRQLTVQPFQSGNGAVETNSAFRSATFATGSASFRMSDVQRLRASDPKSEFFVVVVGDRKNKFFKVKAKDFKTLFGKNP
jgi:hypothetical protein